MVATAGNLQTLFFQSSHPDHLNPSVLQFLRALAFHKVRRLSNANEASPHSRSNKPIGTGSKTGRADGTRLHCCVYIDAGQDLIDTWRGIAREQGLKLRGSEGVQFRQSIGFGVGVSR
jgi:hypothetical protein